MNTVNDCIHQVAYFSGILPDLGAARDQHAWWGIPGKTTGRGDTRQPFRSIPKRGVNIDAFYLFNLRRPPSNLHPADTRFPVIFCIFASI